MGKVIHKTRENGSGIRQIFYGGYVNISIHRINHHVKEYSNVNVSYYWEDVSCKLCLKMNYKIAKQLGFSPLEAKVLSGTSQKKIIDLANQRKENNDQAKKNRQLTIFLMIVIVQTGKPFIFLSKSTVMTGMRSGLNCWRF